MIPNFVRALLNQASWPAAKAQLGTLVEHTPNCAHAVWDYAKDGGAIGDINLRDRDRVLVKIPALATIVNVFYHVETLTVGPTSIDLNCEAANDLVAAANTYTAGANVQGIPDWATVADYVNTTVERQLTLSINGVAASAGKIHFYVFYVF